MFGVGAMILFRNLMNFHKHIKKRKIVENKRIE